MANIFSAKAYCQEHLAEFDAIEKKVQSSPVIASLKSVNDALTKLTLQNTSTVTDIAGVIAKDVSLTARLLRLVNSVFSGLSAKVTSLEEAIFLLGLRKIRQMAMTTRVLEEMDAFAEEGIEESTTDYWRHSLAMAIMSCEVLTMTNGVRDDDQYYITGLLGDAGKLVMLHSFPVEFRASLNFEETTPRKHLERQRKEFGFTYADLGALYLESNNLSPDVVESVLFRHEPEKAGEAKFYAAGAGLADVLARHAGFQPGFESPSSIAYGDWESTQGWEILFSAGRSGGKYAKASILRSIDSLPSLLNGMFE
jgi:HD-like signal output (HDOD) protein